MDTGILIGETEQSIRTTGFRNGASISPSMSSRAAVSDQGIAQYRQSSREGEGLPHGPGIVRVSAVTQ